jgi:integrase
MATRKRKNLYRRPDRPGGIYYAYFYRDGKRIRESLGTSVLSEAKAEVERRMRKTPEAETAPPADPTPAEFWPMYEAWAHDHKRPATVDREKYNWDQFVEVVKPSTLGAVTPGDVERFKRHCLKESKHKPRTINDACVRLQSIYNRARKIEHDDKTPVYEGGNPFQGFDRLEVEALPVKWLSQKQYEALLKAAKGQSTDIYLFCALCIFGGLRLGEAVNAQWSWFDFRAGTFTVQGDDKGEFKTKSKKHRTIPIHERLAKILKPYRRESGYILLPGKTERGKWRVRYEPKRAFATAVDVANKKYKAKIKGATPHTLRHTFASILVSRGVSLYKVQAWLGHASPRTTEIYAHLQPRDPEINKL